MSYSVVILSKNPANLVPCLRVVRRNQPEAHIVVVDDGIGDLSAYVDDVNNFCTIVPGVKPFIYARNANIGIRESGNDDVILLNDDALLMSRGGFDALADAAMDTEYGVIGATANNVGNLNQRPRGCGLREDRRMVCFICVYIPRRTIDAVGLLDERFVGYGFDDDDYCLRVRRAGLRIGILDRCYVDHGSLKSSFRGEPKTPANLQQNHRIFIEKWGSHPL